MVEKIGFCNIINVKKKACVKQILNIFQILKDKWNTNEIHRFLLKAVILSVCGQTKDSKES